MEKIVHTAKHVVNAIVLIQSAPPAPGAGLSAAVTMLSTPHSAIEADNSLSGGNMASARATALDVR
jgi:hypothetical protein